MASNGWAFGVVAEQVSYYHTDAIGSVRMTTSATGQVEARCDYQPFGQPWPSDSAPERRRFAGMERDLETGSGNWEALDYFGARYYSSLTGRFTSVDPLMLIERNIHDPQSWNRYAYVRNNPLTLVDPDGRAWETLWDVANLLYSGYVCVTTGECFDLGADAVATIIPFVPAGTSRLRHLANWGDDLDKLSTAAGTPDRNGLTKAGRALQKHASRPDSAFGTSAKRADDLNEAGQAVVDDILTAPGSVQKGNRLGGIDVVAPDGRGIRYNEDGSFRGFLEPLR